METFGAFLSGFAAGWAVRSTVDGGRQVAVQAIALVHTVSDRARRWVAIEREFFDDLLAEGRAQFERSREVRSVPRTVKTRAAQEQTAAAAAGEHAA